MAPKYTHPHRLTLRGEAAQRVELVRMCCGKSKANQTERRAVVAWAQTIIASMEEAGVPARIALLAVDMAAWNITRSLLRE